MSDGANVIVGGMIAGWLDGDYDLMDAAVLPDLLVKHGLAYKTEFDPELHTDNSGDAEPGDPWYVLTEAGKAVHRRWMGLP